MLDALALLEYRGYDSAGVVLVGEEGLWRRRDAARGRSLEALREAVAGGSRPHDRRCRPHALGDARGRGRAQRPPALRLHRRRWRSSTTASSRTTRSCGTSSPPRATSARPRPTRRSSPTCSSASSQTGAGLAEALRRCVGELRGDFALAAVTSREPRRDRGGHAAPRPSSWGVSPAPAWSRPTSPRLLGTTRDLYQLADDEIAEVTARFDLGRRP